MVLVVGVYRRLYWKWKPWTLGVLGLNHRLHMYTTYNTQHALMRGKETYNNFMDLLVVRWLNSALWSQCTQWPVHHYEDSLPASHKQNRAIHTVAEQNHIRTTTLTNPHMNPNGTSRPMAEFEEWEWMWDAFSLQNVFLLHPVLVQQHHWSEGSLPVAELSLNKMCVFACWFVRLLLCNYLKNDHEAFTLIFFFKDSNAKPEMN